MDLHQTMGSQPPNTLRRRVTPFPQDWLDEPMATAPRLLAPSPDQHNELKRPMENDVPEFWDASEEVPETQEHQQMLPLSSRSQIALPIHPPSKVSFDDLPPPNQKKRRVSKKFQPFSGADDISFLKEAPFGDAALQVICNDGVGCVIVDLDIKSIKEKCPKLASCFKDVDDSRSLDDDRFLHTRLVCRLEGHSRTAAVALLRHIYLGDYTFCEALVDGNIPLLLQLQVFRIALDFEIESLQNMAAMIMERDLDQAVHMQIPIDDLCPALTYLYTELRGFETLRKLLASYCVANFKAHMLSEREAFRQTIFGSPLFHRDLQRANNESEFSSPYANAIVQMPVCEHEVHDPFASGKLSDFTCEFHASEMKLTGSGIPLLPYDQDLLVNGPALSRHKYFTIEPSVPPRIPSSPRTHLSVPRSSPKRTADLTQAPVESDDRNCGDDLWAIPPLSAFVPQNQGSAVKTYAKPEGSSTSRRLYTRAGLPATNDADSSDDSDLPSSPRLTSTSTSDERRLRPVMPKDTHIQQGPIVKSSPASSPANVSTASSSRDAFTAGPLPLRERNGATFSPKSSHSLESATCPTCAQPRNPPESTPVPQTTSHTPIDDAVPDPDWTIISTDPTESHPAPPSAESEDGFESLEPLLDGALDGPGAAADQGEGPKSDGEGQDCWEMLSEPTSP